jgi:hypothetical protein
MPHASSSGSMDSVPLPSLREAPSCHWSLWWPPGIHGTEYRCPESGVSRSEPRGACIPCAAQWVRRVAAVLRIRQACDNEILRLMAIDADADHRQRR